MKVLLPLAAVALIAAGWFGGPLVHPTGATSAPREARPITTALGPWALSSAQLKAEARRLSQRIYWAGPVFGYRYELTRTPSGNVYVRYLPPGVRAGAASANFLIVSTYRFPGGYEGLTRAARGHGIAGPGGSVIFVRPRDPKSILMAFPGVNDQIEVYDPSPARAMSVAHSGSVRSVG
jgi:hypothetical protein